MEKINIVIKHNINNKIKLSIYITDKVKELKKLLSKNDNIKIPLENMMLIHGNLILRDNKILFDYDIIDNDIIFLENSMYTKYGKIDSKLYNILYDDSEYKSSNTYTKKYKSKIK